VDNEACFSGGFTHPGVLGRVVRLALYAGTELVFSPVRHPESNGTVERFHQDYNRHVREDTNLQDCADVQVHTKSAWRKLSSDFSLPQGRWPLTEGRIHFIRLVSADKTISVLNLTRDVSGAEPGRRVWATLELCTDGATLRIYDQAPDASERRCLAEHIFPLKEEVQPRQVDDSGLHPT
jgi:hypothetical protein